MNEPLCDFDFCGHPESEHAENGPYHWCRTCITQGGVAQRPHGFRARKSVADLLKQFEDPEALKRADEQFNAEARAFIDEVTVKPLELLMAEYVRRGEVLYSVIRERDELRALFALQHTRDAEAVALWRAESPEERELLHPDLGRLLEWLMARGERREDAAVKCVRCEQPIHLMRSFIEHTDRLFVHDDINLELHSHSGDEAHDAVLPDDVVRELQSWRERGRVES